MELDHDEILSFLKSEEGRAKTFKELKEHFRLKGGQVRELKALLRRMAKGGLISRRRRRAVQVSASKGLLVGTLTTHPQGYGFVSTDSGGPDVYLAPEQLKEAMPGDKVLVRVRRSKGGKQEGVLAGIVSRTTKEVVGSLIRWRGGFYVEPEDARMRHRVFIPKERLNGAEESQIVVARLLTYPTRYRHAEGEVAEVLGSQGDPRIDSHLVLHKNDIPHLFGPEACLQAAAAPTEVRPQELAGRVDLRDLTTVTIDPEQARDFDDAVSVQPLSKGRARLLVSISDVSHYVKPGDAVDEEAYRRGTSVYFPEEAVPMLPRELSSGICCLHPGCDRLAVTAAMDFASSGDLEDYKFYQSVIRSDARLSYNLVKGILVDKDQALVERFEPLLGQLQFMEELGLKLAAKREKRGSLDFDLPEPELVLDLQGRTEGVVRSERTLAHRIIEEFMLAANERVANFLAEKKARFLYRIHEPPDADEVAQLKTFLGSLGMPWSGGKKALPGDYQKVTKAVEGSALERIVNLFLLRSLKQARYSFENCGHFGLAMNNYTHFTSPIRRYPDLLTHRILKSVLEDRPFAFGERRTTNDERQTGEPEVIAGHTSQRERAAINAEREMWDIVRARFMADKVGQSFLGIVIGIASFGFFVELEEVFVEGLVRLDSLADDYYELDPHFRLLKGKRRGRVIRLGDEVRVEVLGVDTKRGKIALAVLSGKRP